MPYFAVLLASDPADPAPVSQRFIPGSRKVSVRMSSSAAAKMPFVAGESSIIACSRWLMFFASLSESITYIAFAGSSETVFTRKPIVWKLIAAWLDFCTCSSSHSLELENSSTSRAMSGVYPSSYGPGLPGFSVGRITMFSAIHRPNGSSFLGWNTDKKHANTNSRALIPGSGFRRSRPRSTRGTPRGSPPSTHPPSPHPTRRPADASPPSSLDSADRV